MTYPVKIGGETVEIGWTQDVAKRYEFRASKIGGAPRFRDMMSPKTATAAITTFLWLVLPNAEHEKYKTPEDLYVVIDYGKEASAIGQAVSKVIDDMSPDAEKKSTGKKSPSQKSS